MGDQSDRWLWEALLKQAQANLETAHAIRLQSQLKLSVKGAVDMDLDRLEAWFAADCDAEAGAVIAGQIVRQAETVWQDEQQAVGSTGKLGNAGGKGESLEKAEATQAFVAKPIVGTKRRVPSVLELLTAQGAVAIVAEEDKSFTDGIMQAQFSSQRSLGTEAGCSASVKDSEYACSDRHRGRSERLGIEQRGALHLGQDVEGHANQVDNLGSEGRVSQGRTPIFCEPGSSRKASQEGRRDDPGHLGEDAKEHVSQDDKASQGESVPKGIEVAVTSWPKGSVETETIGSLLAGELPRPPETLQRPEGSQMGQTSDISELDLEGFEVAKNIAAKSEVHRRSERVRGLIKDLEGVDFLDFVLDKFGKGEFQDEELCEALEFCAAGRELNGLGPSKIRDNDIEEARLQRLAAKGDEIVIEVALEGKACSGKRAKGKASQRKGYG